LPSVEPDGSPEPHTFRSRLLDGFFNPVAAFGSVNIGGDLMLYAELSEHSTFDRLQASRVTTHSQPASMVNL
jgi:hypothetical protein